MANVKLSDLTALPSTDLATDDLLYVVDVSEALDADKSKKITPDGLFYWQSWTPVFTGFSADPTDVVARYLRFGALCWVQVYMGTAGTSNATGFTVSAPITAATVSGGFWRNSLSFYEDNNTNYRNGGEVTIASAGTVFTLYTPGTNWTGSSEKRAFFQIFYEV